MSHSKLKANYKERRLEIRGLPHQELLDKIGELSVEIRNLFTKLEPYEMELIDRINKKQLPRKNLVINDNTVVALKKYANKLIRVDKLQEKYPHIYQLGLKSVFSPIELVDTLEDKTLVLDLIRECGVYNPKLELRYSPYKKKIERNKRK